MLGPEKPGGPSRPDPESPWAKANVSKLQKMGFPGKGVVKSKSKATSESQWADLAESDVRLFRQAYSLINMPGFFRRTEGREFYNWLNSVAKNGFKGLTTLDWHTWQPALERTLREGSQPLLGGSAQNYAQKRANEVYKKAKF